MWAQNEGTKLLCECKTYIGYGASPQYSTCLNIAVSKIKIEILRFYMMNGKNIILEEAYSSIIVHTLFGKNQP